MQYSKYTIFCDYGNESVVFNTLNKHMKVIPRSLASIDINNSSILQRELSDFIVSSEKEETDHSHCRRYRDQPRASCGYARQ